jgi:hypothetical protein
VARTIASTGRFVPSFVSMPVLRISSIDSVTSSTFSRSKLAQ